MRKHESFKKQIKKNRKLLLSLGFLPSTLTMWSTGQRIPRKEQARSISVALKIKDSDIPVRQSVIR